MVDTTVPYAGLPPTAALGRGPPARPWGVWATLVWAGAGMLFISLFEMANWGWGLKLSFELRIVWGLFGYCVIAAGLLLAVRATPVPVGDYLGLTRLRVRDVLLGIACFIVLPFVWPYISALIKQFIGSWPDDRFDQPLSGLILALALFVTIIVGPLVEELLFRGFMYRGLESSLGTVATVLITGVTFGLVHALYGYGWDHVAGSAFFGLVLGLLRWLTGGITASFVCHALGNAPSISAIPYLVGKLLE